MPTQTVLKGLEHHALFLLLVQLAVMLATTRVLGEVMRKLGQPPVVGELAGGVLLGPSVFGLAWPDLQATIFPRIQSQADLLAVVAWLGVLFLLIVTGLETDLALIRKKGRTALLISAGGIITPFATGFALGELLPASFLVDAHMRVIFALFMAVAMSISAVPVIAKVLFDLKLMRRDIGQLTLAAAMVDDTIGWLLLSVVAGLASRGALDVTSVGISAGTAVLFLLFALTVGGRLVDGVLVVVDEAVGTATAQLSTVLVLALAAAAFTQAMNIEAVLGAFVVGILAGQARRFRSEVGHALEAVTTGFLAPIFFASAGLKVDLVRLFDADVLVVAAVVLAIACVGKFAGCYVGAWAGGLPRWERLAVGSGMNARGAMEIIVATVGLSLHVLTPEMYSVIVMVAIVTSLMAPPLLRFCLARVQIGAEEANRLESEALAASSFVRSIRRVLLIAKNAEQAALAGELVASLRKAQPVEVTALYADLDQPRVPWWRLFAEGPRRAYLALRDTIGKIRKTLRQIQGQPSSIKVATGPDAIDIALKEAALGYDLIVMAVGRTSTHEGVLFGRVIDRVIKDAPCPTLVLRASEREDAQAGGIDGTSRSAARQAADPSVKTIQRLLVPTIGTEYSKNALEAAAVLAKSAGARVTVLHVIERPATPFGNEQQVQDRAREIAAEVVEHQAEVARKFGAEVDALVVEDLSPEAAILDLVARERYDLIVMGTSLRTIRKRAFFGHRAETLLKSAPCSVAVMSTP